MASTIHWQTTAQAQLPDLGGGHLRIGTEQKERSCSQRPYRGVPDAKSQQERARAKESSAGGEKGTRRLF